MSDHTGQHAGTSSQEHHNATSHGASRMHNGNVYYYYASDMRIAGLAQEPIPIKAPTETATENGAKLWRAARFGQLPRVQRLLKLRADVGYRCNEHGTTALHQAVWNSHKDVVEALLEADASVDDMDHEGKTALHYATSADIVESLVMAGADVDHEDRESKTPGRLALDREDTAVVQALVKGRADPSKIYQPREETHSIRLVASGSRPEEIEEDTDVQAHHIREVTEHPANHEQNADRIPDLASEFTNVNMHLPVRRRSHSNVPMTGDRSTEQTALQQHSIRPGRDQMCEQDFVSHVPRNLAPKARNQSSTADSIPALNVREFDQGPRLIIAINFPGLKFLGSQTYYAVGPDVITPGDDVKNQSDEYPMTRTSFRLRKTIEQHLRYDDDLSQGRVDSVWLKDNRFEIAAQPAKDDLSEYIETLGMHITAEIASRGSGTPVNKFRKEVLMVVPPDWPGSLRRTLMQAAMVTNVSKATVVTAFEGAILDALYCRRTKFAQQIRDGDAYLVCDLDISRFRCTKQKISSTKPFRLRQLGLSSACCRQADEDKWIFDLFKSRLKKEAEGARKLNESIERLAEDVGECAARRLLDPDLTDNKAKAILLLGPGWSPYMQARIQRHCPEMSIICSYTHDVDVDEELRGAMKYALMQ